MKTRFAFRFLLTAPLALLPLLNGCTQQSASSTPTYITTSNPPPPPVVTQVVPAPVEPAPPAPVAESVTAPTVPPLIISNAPPIADAPPVVPANLRITKPLSEVIRLAQSGVDEFVILTYITNSTTLFALGAEEIVYLNDLGVASPVVTAMMHRDQSLKSAWASAGQVVPQPPTNQEAVAAAPTYVNPPQVVPVPVQEAQPVYVSNDYFYDTLSPYGTWVEVDGYGRVWRPTVAINSSGWQPYRDRGRWVHTDAGWYWMSDYSWGSVAFHYGRWFSHPRWGWCWWPDTQWAPSWVTWRYDNDNCGWAPLPPRTYFRPGVGFSYYDRHVGFDFDFGLSVGAFTFVPWGRFCDPYPYRHCLPRARSIAIYNQTTVINNVVIGNNNTIINRGIPTDRVRERTRTEVRTVQIREVNERNPRPRQEHFERDGRTLVVRRPQFTPVAATSPAAPITGRAGRTDSESRNDDRRAPRSTTPAVVTTPASPFTPTGPVARPVATPAPDRSKSNQENNTPRARDNQATVVRLPETRTVTTPAPVAPVTTPAAPTRTATPTATPDREARRMEATPRPTANSPTVIRRTEPTPAQSPTPIFSKPLVVETPAYTPTREVISGAPAQSPVNNPRPSRASVRENSTWSAPAAQPNASAPNYNNAPSRRSAVIESAPAAPAAPVYNRPNVEIRREVGERTVRSSAETRSVAPSYTPPAPRFSAPEPAPRPSYTPPAPAPSAPRVEAQPAAPRSEPRSESRSEPRSDSGRSPRNR